MYTSMLLPVHALDQCTPLNANVHFYLMFECRVKRERGQGDRQLCCAEEYGLLATWAVEDFTGMTTSQLVTTLYIDLPQ